MKKGDYEVLDQGIVTDEHSAYPKKTYFATVADSDGNKLEMRFNIPENLWGNTNRWEGAFGNLMEACRLQIINYLHASAGGQLTGALGATDREKVTVS